MPSRVETLIALGRVPLLASLSTRQLADVAERARWSTARAGSIIVTSGDLIDALIVVDDGELTLGNRVITKGEVVDELACFAPTQIAKRTKDWGQAELDQKVGEAWHRYSTWTDGWLQIEHCQGPDAVEATFERLVGGDVDPRAGYACSMTVSH